MIVKELSQDEIATNWAFIEQKIIENLAVHDTKEYGIEFFRLNINSGRWNVIGFIRNDVLIGICVLAIVDYPFRKIAVSVAFGGKGISGRDSFDGLMKVLKNKGAVTMQFTTTPAAARLFCRLGFKENGISLKVDVNV